MVELVAIEAAHTQTAQTGPGLGAGEAPMGQLALRLRLIGPMAAWNLEPASVLPPGRKTRALLAILALSAPHAMRRARLAEMLWSGRPEEPARASLRQELHRLQDALSPCGVELLQVNRDQVALRTALVWTDVGELLGASREHPSALVLFDRELLEGMDGIDPLLDLWLIDQRERLRGCARELAEHVLADLADPDMAMMAAQRLLAIDGAHEGAWRAMIRGFALRGEHGMAIQAFERCKATLAEHLNALPSPETIQLVAQIRGERRVDEVDGLADGRGAPVLVHPPRPVATGPVVPRVGVLPPRLAGEGTALLPMALGLADELSAALSRCRWFSTVSSGAVQRLARAGEDEGAMRRVLGLDYLLDGSLTHTVGAAGRRVRLSMRLVDLAADQNVIWAEKFDAEADDLFDLQDRLAGVIVARVEGAMMAAEASRTGDVPPRVTGYLRAVQLMTRFDRTDYEQAGVILRRAAEEMPERGDVFGWLGFWHLLGLMQSWEPEPITATARALALTERGQALDPMDPRPLVMHGVVRHLAFRRPHEAMVLYERAQLLNPNMPSVWALSALAQLHLGRAERAEERLAECARLASLHPLGFMFDTVKLINAVLRQDFEAAVQLGRELTELHPGYIAPYSYYLAALGHLGRGADAAVVLVRAVQLAPLYSLADIAPRLAVFQPADRELILTGLRRAGVAAGE